MGTPFYKQGVSGRGLRKPMRRLNAALCEVYGDIFITSTDESAANRIVDSLHYPGFAEDIRNYAVKTQEGIPHIIWLDLAGLKGLCKRVSQSLGIEDGFDIVEYDNFFHIEWDPKE